jgi:photosystem II stability/assembly factor-like uncharacterized protein
MKKTLFFFYCIISTYCFSQNNWKNISPQPTGMRLHDVSMVSENEYWILSDNGKMLHTINGGATWQVLQHPAFFPEEIKMFTSSSGWLVAGGDTSYKTFDGGASWIPVFIPSHASGAAYAKSMVQLWFSCNGDSLLSTTDGGITWDVDSMRMSVMTFADSLRGWMFTENGVRKTSDGGLTWNYVSSDSIFGLAEPIDASFPDSLTGFLSAMDWNNSVSQLFKTTDGGVSWVRQNSFNGDIYGGAAIVFFDTLRGIALNPDSYQSNYYITGDGGVSWTAIPLYEKGGENSGDHINNTIIAAGGQGTIIKSTDAGQTFSDLITRAFPAKYLNSVSFPDTLTGYIDVSSLDNNEGIYKTIDGGNTWLRIDSSSSSATEIFFLTPQIGWVNSQGGHTIKITSDGGISWQNSMPPDYSIYDFCFVSSTRGWAGE